MAKGREVDALLQKFGFIVVRKERERQGDGRMLML